MKLVEEMESVDPYMRKMATQMWNRFSKYWSDFNLLLAIAVVFDPRYKFTFVEFSYKKLYGEGSLQLKMVEDTLFALYDEYMQASKNSTVGCESASFHDSNNNQSRQGNVEGGPSHNILEWHRNWLLVSVEEY